MSVDARRKTSSGHCSWPWRCSALDRGRRRPSGAWAWGASDGDLVGFNQVPKPESFFYSKALIDAGRDTHIPSRNVYANNPNSYINHIRDNGFVERYDVARQRSLLLSLRAPSPRGLRAREQRRRR